MSHNLAPRHSQIANLISLPEYRTIIFAATQSEGSKQAAHFVFTVFTH